MSLNDSVIRGKCHSCLIQEEKVACLEGEIEAKDAALVEADWWLDHWGERYAETSRSLHKAKQTVRAALSDKGKGTEVREQARKAIGHAFHLIEHNKAMCVRCRGAKQRLQAALTALGGT